MLQVILNMARLVAQPGSQDILELCEMRNMLLVGLPSQFKFINFKQSKVMNSSGIVHGGTGFFSDYGRPNMAMKNFKITYFWPDEWEQELGGTKGIGHFAKVYQGDGIWKQGKITDYTAETDEYTIIYDPEIGSSTVSAAEGLDGKAPEPQKVKLKESKFTWVDAANKHRLSSGSGGGKGAANDGSSLQLRFGLADKGMYIRIWWSRYKRFFYGRIVDYDSRQRQHSVVYEDGDMRAYDLTMKEFELIAPPQHLSGAIAVAESDQAKSRVVSEWHRTQGQPPDSGGAGVPQNAGGAAGLDSERLSQRLSQIDTSEQHSRSSIDAAQSGQSSAAVVSRPTASQGYATSIHSLAAINEFFAEGGAEAIFQGLVDETQAPPSCQIILLHLQLAYGLRFQLKSSTFKSFVWELKEGIPTTLMRLQDAQIKGLTPQILGDCIYLLKELITLSASSQLAGDTQAQAQFHARTVETLELLKLSVASTLLRCSQLQKRYMGLAMIKDAVDAAMPRVSVFVSKRAASLNNMRPPPPKEESKAKYSLTIQQVEKWIIDNKIVEELFGQRLHQDLAAKSDILLVFLAHRRELTDAHLDLLWQSARGAHEAIVRVIHHLVLLIVPVLEPPLRMHLFSLISSVPTREYGEQILYMIKNYTVQALIAFKEEAVGKGLTKGGSPSRDPQQPGAGGSGQDAENALSAAHLAADLQSAGSLSSGMGRKGLVTIAPQRQWMGFGVLWQFVQDPSESESEGIDEGLIDLAIQLLVELLREEFKDERELVMQRCLDNIQMGMSVPVSLHVLRLTLGTYPTPSKSWFSMVGRATASKGVTVANQIERLQKQNRMLDIFFTDLARYFRNISEKVLGDASRKSKLAKSSSSYTLLHLVGPSSSLVATDSAANLLGRESEGGPGPGPKLGKQNRSMEQLNDSRWNANGTMGRTSHLKGVAERLEFLKFVLSNSPLSLDENQTMLVWRALGQGAITVESLDKLVLWLEGMFTRENKAFCSFITSLAQESDPMNPNEPSKLAFLGMNEIPTFPTGMGSVTGGPANEKSDAGEFSSFEDGVLGSLFEGCIVQWGTRSENVGLLNRPYVASFCLKLFLLVNVINRAIKLEPDGSWFRTGQLSGLGLLWRMAVDVQDRTVADAAISLITELHHRMPPKFKGIDTVRAYLLKLSFKQLSISIQSLRIGDEPNDHDDGDGYHVGDSPPRNSPTAIVAVAESREAAPTAQHRRPEQRTVVDGEGFPIVVAPVRTPGRNHAQADTFQTPAKNDDWFEDGDQLPDTVSIARRVARFIMLLRLFIQRFNKQPSQLCSIQVLAGKDDTPVMTLTLRASDTLLVLRRKIGDHFKEPVENISLLKPNRSPSILGTGFMSNSERLERDDFTLRQLKFATHDSVIARKKEVIPPMQVGKQGQLQNGGQGGTELAVEDLIKSDDLTGNLLDVLEPLSWLSQGSDHMYADNETQEGAQGRAAGKADTGKGGTFVFTIPVLPLTPHADMTLCGEYSSIPMLNPDGTAPTIDKYSKLIDFLGPYLRQSPEYIDQLLEMLDGYLSAELQVAGGSEFDLCAAVWEVLQSLPTHASLLKHVRSLPHESSTASIRQLLDATSPYRLLYTLQVIDSFLAGENDLQAGYSSESIAKKILEWSLAFLYQGGAEHVVSLLQDLSERVIKGTLKKSSATEMGMPNAGGKRDGSDGMGGLGDAGMGGVGGTHGSAAGDDVGAKEKSWGSVSRHDAYVLSIAMLHRVLHRLLILDPMYSCWQGSYLKRGAIPMYLGREDNNVPPGLVITCLQARSFVKKTFESIYTLTHAFADNIIASSSLQALAENALMLVMGVLTALDDGCEVLRSCINFQQPGLSLEQFLRALCLRIPVQSVRAGTCRRIFDACANIWHMCFDISRALSQEKKSARVALFDYLFNTIITCANDTVVEGGEDEETFLGGTTLSALSSISSPCRAPGFVHSTSNEIHYQDVLKTQAEEVYSLIAGLQALISSPGLIIPLQDSNSTQDPTIANSSANELAIRSVEAPQIGSTLPKNGEGSGAAMAVKRNDLIDANTTRLCKLFVEKLIRHPSQEPYHASGKDGTLVGILRVLLILAGGEDKHKNVLGSYKFSANKSMFSGMDLITHLYIKCLFPSDSSSIRSSGGVEGFESTLGSACQTPATRSLAYAVLFQLCRSHIQNFSRLIMVMTGLDADELIVSGLAKPRSSSSLHEDMENLAIAEGKTLPASVIQFLQQRVCDLVTARKKVARPWSYDPGALLKEPGAFVGLQNQGGTCYMNSLLQQLYHVPKLSAGLLQIETSLQTGEDGAEAEEDDNQSVLFQLQVLFGYLKVSQKRYYDTLPFCKVFKDYDGEPIRLGEQKDINEFAGMLFDKLEHNKQCADLLSRTIRGELVYKTRSTETTYKSDRPEAFYMITAEVKNKPTLEDSLELLIAEELFSGDNKLEDPVAKRKVEAYRRCAIRTLPPTLIVHLKRFEFDIEAMGMKKVNDTITFPMQLDMFPYSEKGIALREAKLRSRADDLEEANAEDTAIEAGASAAETCEGKLEESEATEISGEDAFVERSSSDALGKIAAEESAQPAKSAEKGAEESTAAAAAASDNQEDYMYALKGVVAHVGTIDRGHYYSFIKEPTTSKWMEFNDRSVLPFSAEAIPSECFGGEEQVNTPTGPQMRMRQNNAYLLFYEQVKKTPSAQSAPSATPTDTKAKIAAVSKEEGKEGSQAAKEPQLPTGKKAVTGAEAPQDVETIAASAPTTVRNRLASITFDDIQTKESSDSFGMAERVQQAVWTENMEFQTDRFLYDPIHFRFLWQLQHTHSMAIMMEKSHTMNVTNFPLQLSPKSSNLERFACLSLSQMVLCVLRFGVEVVARARAQGCMNLFFEHLEEIVIQDSSRMCAEAIVHELASDRSQIEELLGVTSPQKPPSPAKRIGSGRRLSSKSNVVNMKCHPWLIQIFYECPQSNSVKAFSRFLLTCAKVLRASHYDDYLTVNDSAPTLAEDMDDYGPPVLPFQLSVNRAQFSRYKSSVTRLVDKLLLITEKMQPEDAVGREGFRSVTGLLLNIAQQGFEEKQMMMGVGALYRLVSGMMGINPSVNRIPGDEVALCAELVSTLIRSAIILPPEKMPAGTAPTTTPQTSAPDPAADRSPFMTPEASNALDSAKSKHLYLTTEDLQVFLNRIYLEESIPLCTVSTSAALQHVCWSRGGKEALKILEFVAEKVSECAMQQGGVSLAYRSYFKAVSELLLGPAVNIALAFEHVIPSLIHKAESLCVRQAQNDSEFIYSVLKLLHRLGCSDAKAHACVMRVRDLWRTLPNKFAQNKRMHQRTEHAGGEGAERGADVDHGFGGHMTYQMS